MHTITPSHDCVLMGIQMHQPMFDIHLYEWIGEHHPHITEPELEHMIVEFIALGCIEVGREHNQRVFTCS